MLSYRHRVSLPPVFYLIIFGAATWYYGSRARTMLRGARHSLRWRPVEGEIIWSMVDERATPWYAAQRRRTLGDSGDRTQYRADIRYSYHIGSKQYEGRRVYFGADSWSSREVDATGLIDLYPRGKKLQVFVDPARPAETVLERGRDRHAKKQMWAAIACGAGTAVVLWAVVVHGLWTWK